MLCAGVSVETTTTAIDHDTARAQAAVADRVRATRWARIAGGVTASALGAATFGFAWTHKVDQRPGEHRAYGDERLLAVLVAALPAGAIVAALVWAAMRPRRDAETSPTPAQAKTKLGAARRLARQSVAWPLIGATLVGPLLVQIPLFLYGPVASGLDLPAAIHVGAVLTTHLLVCALVGIIYPGALFLAGVVVPAILIGGWGTLVPAYAWVHAAVVAEVNELNRAEATVPVNEAQA
jgi:hypothetical protein